MSVGEVTKREAAAGHPSAAVKPLDSTGLSGERWAMSSPHALIVGCGYLGEAVADLLHARGWPVTGWTASPASAARLAGTKAYPVAAHDVTDRAAVVRAADGLPAPAVIIDCVSSGRGGPEQYRRVYLDGTRHLLAAFPGARLIFTGSTSVYAQTDGSLVDETSLAAPARETGRILLETESLVLAAGGTVARLSGIYGPGRAGLLDKFLAGQAIIEGDGSRWLNHIHRTDGAAALVHLAGPEVAAGIYNVTDGQPITQLALYRGLAAHFGRDLPASGPLDLDRKRGWTSKRVSNQRLRAAGWQPEAASYLDWVRDEKTVLAVR